MSSEHERYATWDGAYVLGALSDAERQEFSQHLASCDECRKAVSELAPLDDLLARVDPADLDAPSSALPPEVEARLARAARSEHSVRRRRSALSAAVTLAAAAVVAAIDRAAAFAQHDVDPGTVRVVLVRRVDIQFAAHLLLAPSGQGTRIAMTVRYSQAPSSGPRPYELDVFDHVGNRHVVSRWDARPGEVIQTTGITNLLVTSIRKIELRDVSDAVVLASRTL